MLAYTALLYQKLIGEGVLREHDALPPVLPIVICNGRRRWSAAADVSDPIASGGAALHAEREGAGSSSQSCGLE